MPPDLIFGSPLSQLQDESTPQRGPLPFLLKSFHFLSCAFDSIRENFQSFHQRKKDYYDLGAVERIFTPGDIVRVRLKSRTKGPSKFHSEWSTPHRVISVKGVVVTLQKIDSDLKYVVHYDRLSYPIYSGKEFAPRELEANANPEENEQDYNEDFEPVVYPDEALIRTHSGRTVKSTKKKDFEYNFMLPSYNILPPLISSSLETHLQSTPLTSKALATHLLLFFSTTSYSLNLLYSSYRKLFISPGPCRAIRKLEFAASSAPKLRISASKSSEFLTAASTEWHSCTNRAVCFTFSTPAARIGQRFRRSQPDASPHARRLMAATAQSPRADRPKGRTPWLAGRILWVRPRPSRTPSIRVQRRVATLHHRMRSSCCRVAATTAPID